MQRSRLSNWQPHHLAVAAILVGGAALRFWGVDFGLPHTQARPDETQIIDVTRQFLSGNLKPAFYDYPWLYMWISTGLYLGYYLIGLAAGWFHSVADLVASWPVHWEPFFLINRALSATMGTLTILGVYGIARRLWDQRTAVVAALFMAGAFIHVRDSHFGSTDTTMTLLVVLSTLWLVDGHLTGRRQSFVLAGLMGGLATATKYNAGVVMFPVLVSQLVQVIESRRAGATRFDGRMFWFGVPCFLAFMIGVPFLVNDYDRFRAAMDLLSASMSSGTGPVSDSLGSGWLHHLRFSLYYGVGAPILVLAAIAAAWQLRQRPGITLVLLTFPVIYFYVIGSVRNLFFRYAIPMVPFLCLLAAWAVVAFCSRLTRSRTPTAAGVLTAAVALLVLAPSLYSAVQFDRLAATTDNRVVVARWFDAHVPAGASILQSGSPYGHAQFTPQRFSPWEWNGRARIFTLDRYHGRRPAEGRPDYILLQESPLPNATQEQVTALLASGYAFEAQFPALKLDQPHVYDLQDAFFIPFAGFGGVDRPGPNFTLYKNVQ